jgi:hypothetical protein
MSISCSSCGSPALAAATKIKENNEHYKELAAHTAPAPRLDSVAISAQAQQLLAQETRGPQ